MKVSCPSCQTNYNIDDKRIPPGGAKLKCARCQNTFPIKAEEPVSAPPPAPAAIPLPGAAMPSADYSDRAQGYDPSQSAAGYDVSVAQGGAIPLPGASDPYASNPYGNDPYAGAQGDAVPLPGASDGYADNSGG